MNKRKKILYLSTFILTLFLCCLFIVWLRGGLNFWNTQKTIQKVSLKNTKEKVEKVSMIMVGDVLIHSRVYRDAYKNEKYDFNYIFDEARDFFKNYDLFFYNQESIIGGKKLGVSTYPRFNSPEEIGNAMVKLGANLVSLANNHSFDKGEKGIENSLKYWSGKNVIFSGTFKNQEDFEKVKTFKKNGIRFAFLSYTTLTNGLKSKKKYLINTFSKEKFLKDIEKVRDKVDVVLVSIHWGVEYRKEPTEKQKEIAKFLAKNGADVVIGTHPHVIEPIEKIENTLVVYSLGNFISSQIGEARKIGLNLSLEFYKKENEIFIKNIKPYLSYVKFSLKRPYNFRVIPFSRIDNEDLKNWKKIEKKYLKNVKKIGDFKLSNRKKYEKNN